MDSRHRAITIAQPEHVCSGELIKMGFKRVKIIYACLVMVSSSR